MTGFAVTPEDLDAHAEVLKAIARDVQACAAAANQVGYGGTEAYGILLQWLIPPVLECLLGDTSQLLQDAADLASDISNGLQANSGSYRDVDTQAKILLSDTVIEGRLYL